MERPKEFSVYTERQVPGEIVTLTKALRYYLKRNQNTQIACGLCSFCGKIFYAELRRQKQRFCTLTCVAKSRNSTWSHKGGNYFYNKYGALHRQVVSSFIGRKLKSKEYIHHIDYNTRNNKLDNLVVVSNTENLRFNGKIIKRVIQLLPKEVIQQITLEELINVNL